MNDTLELRIARPLRPVTHGDLESATSEAKVISDMIKNSGLQDKTVALEIEIDTAILSKAKSGQARLSESHMDRLMDTCGSELWLLYWLRKRGYNPFDLRRIETDLERENRELRERLNEIEREREVELRLYAKLRTA